MINAEGLQIILKVFGRLQGAFFQRDSLVVMENQINVSHKSDIISSRTPLLMQNSPIKSSIGNSGCVPAGNYVVHGLTCGLFGN